MQKCNTQLQKHIGGDKYCCFYDDIVMEIILIYFERNHESNSQVLI